MGGVHRRRARLGRARRIAGDVRLGVRRDCRDVGDQRRALHRQGDLPCATRPHAGLLGARVQQAKGMRRHEEAVVAIGSRLAGEPSGDVHHEVPTRGGVHHEPVGRHGHNHGAGSRRAGAIHIHERRRRGRSAVGAGSEVPARSADTGDVHGQRDGVGGHAVRQRHLHARPWRERCAAAGVQQSVGRERLEPAGRGRCGGDEHAEVVVVAQRPRRDAGQSRHVTNRVHVHDATG